MKIDPLNIFAGVLFFVLGFLLENYLSFPTFEIGSVAEIISALCTAAAVVVGALALKTWEHQFAYQERYKNIIALEAVFNNAMVAFHRYRYKFFECSRNNVVCIKEQCEWDEFKSYQEAFFKYRQQWNATTFALDKKVIEQFEFKPDQLERRLIQFLTPIIEKYHYDPEQRIVCDDQILNFDKELDMLSAKVIEKLRTLTGIAKAVKL